MKNIAIQNTHCAWKFVLKGFYWTDAKKNLPKTLEVLHRQIPPKTGVIIDRVLLGLEAIEEPPELGLAMETDSFTFDESPNQEEHQSKLFSDFLGGTILGIQSLCFQAEEKNHHLLQFVYVVPNREASNFYHEIQDYLRDVVGINTKDGVQHGLIGSFVFCSFIKKDPMPTIKISSANLLFSPVRTQMESNKAQIIEAAKKMEAPPFYIVLLFN
ncbi:hypothetical protein A3J90_03525 [candidate division WOR-1 bacterium RIFOXYC2_FULL_37_10]|uniref:Uncharacterized protein n=1 Tax=candidate division WOR-1 bacterium RIFOXYB2_FULL_37_13 TaxID=1802579 RepID=A0A1F4SKU1_UNCSA|nr:MAG: hypothetical protein A2246_02395 [candidate division WOR-1 bacterium RIFOXYA2_FULL_37_7]OGC21019.1 MAG: hypothetical protein A2310_00675 [candidate division WOR-1 bacterium RIFOXYB2_FULL_37_13]OGC33526.1 MAG: hypothetical protein A3J90_03525 [candidate division WOR-1 bacterium RIFOXYC2_FULL_37_10]